MGQVYPKRQTIQEVSKTLCVWGEWDRSDSHPGTGSVTKHIYPESPKLASKHKCLRYLHELLATDLPIDSLICACLSDRNGCKTDRNNAWVGIWNILLLMPRTTFCDYWWRRWNRIDSEHPWCTLEREILQHACTRWWPRRMTKFDAVVSSLYVCCVGVGHDNRQQILYLVIRSLIYTDVTQ